jgi:deoxyribonuclease V
MPVLTPVTRVDFEGLTPGDARALQEELSARVVEEDRLGPGSEAPTGLEAVRSVCGLDLSHAVFSSRAHAAAVVYAYPGLGEVEAAVIAANLAFPYVPGLLAFRELPALVQALSALSASPGVLIVDGHGRAHPRRMGIACHLGVALDLPALGCAKSALVGEPAGVLPDDPGASVALVDRGEVVGAVLRTRRGSRPVYVSVGHRISLPTALSLVKSLGTGLRLPLPVRGAHSWANRGRRGEIELGLNAPAPRPGAAGAPAGAPRSRR